MRLAALPPLVFLAILTLAHPAWAGPQARPQAREHSAQWIPPALQSWEGWVLFGLDAAGCPPRAGDPALRECAFPSRLSVQAGEFGAGFTMTWRVFAARNVPLPHAPGLWPAAVTVDGQPAAVLDASGTPEVRLEPGEHQVAGALVWKRMPRFLTVAAATGVVDLSVNQKPVPLPRLGADGRLALGEQEQAGTVEETFQVKVFRLVSDGVPMTVTTLARLEVSGRSRTITLDGLLPPGTEPMGVSSPVPAGFGPDGQVLAQAGAGRYDIEITSRFPGPVKEFGPASAPFGREIWALRPAPELRDLQAKGLPPIDAKTTDLPDAWKGHPAFLADAGAKLEFSEIRRGEAGPRGDDLHVKRTFWLDFDGKGLTSRDSITGTMRRAWSLTMTAPGELGRAGTPGGDLPVIILGKDGARGVELREAAVKLDAEARYPDLSASIPATGWRADASSLSAELRLPPGWRLFDASGPDSVSHSWISQWNLLNIFLTLFMVLGAFKLRGALAGAVLLAFLALAQHEPGAPVEAWLPLLAALGLVRAFESQNRPGQWSRAGKGARVLYGICLGALALISLPFVAGQMRAAIHPQLEDFRAVAPFVQKKSVESPEEAPAPAAARLKAGAALKQESRDAAVSSYQSSLEQDPNSLIQTGPGLPAWQWRTVRLGWNGPVGQGQTLSLVLVSPAVSSALCLARVGLLLAAIGLLAGIGLPRPRRAAGAAAAVLLAALFPAAGWASDMPSREILEEFRQRLVKPAGCFPICAGVSEMAVVLDGQSLKLTLTAGAAARLVLPLPVVSDGWRPRTVTVDGKPASLFAADGGLWVLLEEGPHTVILAGPPPAGVSFGVSAPFPARSAKVEAPGWNILGVGPEGALEGGLTFTGKDDSPQAGKQAMTAVIKPFLEVERVLGLGLTWDASTTVRRLTRSGEPVVVKVPLLPGESVLGQDVRVEDGKAVVALAAGQRQASWRSRLEIAPSLELYAPEGVPWVETWRLSASPVWDVKLSGIPVVSSLDASGLWTPLWRPWPGEKAAIAVTRPAPAPGESLTIDSARLGYAPGKRLDAATLMLRMRSALGGRHILRLPPDAEVTAVSMGGRPAPWSSDKPGEVGIALIPGGQDVSVAWRQPRESLGVAATPAVDLGHPAVNVTVAVDMPRDRWILWARGSTALGPAILFWSAVGVCAVAAFGLGFLPWTPLRRRHWFLLGLGLTQVDATAAILAVAWILALGARRRHAFKDGWFGFNAVQVGLVVLTLLGLASLFEAIRTGLLGAPHTIIAGNGSSAYHLAWYFDRIGSVMPVTEVLSLSVWWYRGLMLAWSLWMALALLGWLRWGWESFSVGGAWRKPELKLPRIRQEKSPEGNARAPVLREGLTDEAGKEKKE